MATILNNTLANTSVATQTANGTTISPKQLTTTSSENKIFKNQPTNIGTDLDIANTPLKDVDKLINSLLNELKANPSESKLNELATKAKELQVSPNLVKDMKNLVKMIEEEPEFKNFAIKLKEFLKPIVDLKAIGLNDQIKNSGIMLEANLKDALTNKFNLSSTINKLFSDIKNLSNTKLLNQISDLANDDSLNTIESFARLDKILQTVRFNDKQILENSPFKSLINTSSKLENMVKFINKQSNAIQNLGLSLNDKSLNLQLYKIKQSLNSIDLNVMDNEKFNKNIGFNSNLKELRIAIKTLENELEILNASSDKFGDFAKNISQNADGPSLQDKLQNVAKKLNFALQIADKSAFEAKNNLDEVGRLIKQQNIARADIEVVTAKSSDDIAKSLSNDIKSVLLNINQKSAPESQIKDLSLKMLSQIEMHQLISSVAGGIQSYLPYVWDGVDGGNIRFKQGKKQKHYAQIDLNFQKFGQINIMVSLIDNKYIDISIATQKEDFKELLQSGQKELKKAISNQGLVVSNFSLKTLPKLSLKAIYNKFDKLDMGFDKKI